LEGGYENPDSDGEDYSGKNRGQRSQKSVMFVHRPAVELPDGPVRKRIPIRRYGNYPLVVIGVRTPPNISNSGPTMWRRSCREFGP
jgi:hypothetical protein